MRRDFYTCRGFQIVTDALHFTRRLVEHSVIERAFDPGRFKCLSQRNHWRLIGEDLFFRGRIIQPCVGDGY